MKVMKTYLLRVLLMVVLFGSITCSEEQSDSVDRLFLSQAEDFKVILKINKDEFNAKNEARLNKRTSGQEVKIVAAKRENDILKLDVNYSGGCSFHSFTIIWDGIVYTDPPCYMNLLIVHNSEDSCEASITETIEINLKDLIGDVSYKDDCGYKIFTTFNSTDTPDQEVKGMN